MTMSAQARSRLWCDCPVFDEKTRAAALLIAQDEEETLRCFSQELAFGTGGLRGTLGVGSNRMNEYTVARATTGLADYLLQAGGRSVAIAYDSRLCSRDFAYVTAGVLAKKGLRALVYGSLMPTPMLSFAVRTLGCDAGVVITASHNPSQYNGYKVYGPDGCQITDQAAAQITGYIDRVSYEQLGWLSEPQARQRGLLETIPQSVFEDFIQKTLSRRVESLPATELNLVYTPLNGTGLVPVSEVFSRIGVGRLTVVEAQRLPDGRFPTCPKPNPELPEALALGIQTAKEQGADLLIATDPDCDRVGVAVRNAQGDYEILSGNEVGLLLLDRLLSKTQVERPLCIKTIVTSDLAFSIAKAHGAELTEVLTGFKYIGEAIGRLEAKGEAERFVFGFEESCGYLAGAHVRDKDGVMAAMLVADYAAALKREGRSLLRERDALYARYGYMANRLLNVDIEDAVPMERMAAILSALRAKPPKSLCGFAVCSAKDYRDGLDGLPPSNVLSFANEQGCKLIVRPSGTEPKVKLYLSAKGASMEEALRKLDALEADARALVR